MLTSAKEKIPMASATSVSVKPACVLRHRVRKEERAECVGQAHKGSRILGDRRLLEGMASDVNDPTLQR